MLALLAAPALATTCGAPPYTLVNGQTADASQVMANFTALVACSNNVLTSATIDGAIITNPTISGTTAIAVGATLTSPTINTPTITAATMTGANTIATGAVFTGDALAGTTVLPGSGAISSGGLLGLGMSPTNILDITQSTTGDAIAKVLNSNAGAVATARLQVSNGTSTAEFAINGASYTTSGMFRQNGAYIYSGSAVGGLSIISGAVQPIYFGINSVEMMRINTAGNVGIGTTTPAQKLEVNGQIKIDTLAAASSTPLCVNANVVASCAQTTWSTGATLATGVTTFTHNLGVDYKARIQVVIVNASTDAGYAAGDSVVLSSTGPAGASNNLLTIGSAMDGNSSFAIIGIGVSIANKSTAALVNLTLNKWTLYIGVTPNS